jgi:transcriptional regulator with XRE-family HTH domain
MAATKTTLAGTLIRLRQASGLSVRQLEDASGVARSVISRLENGLYLQPSPSTLTRLANALGAEASELLTVAGYTASEAEALPTIRPYLRTKYGHLSADARQDLADFLERLEAGQISKRSSARKPKK